MTTEDTNTTPETTETPAAQPATETSDNQAQEQTQVEQPVDKTKEEPKEEPSKEAKANKPWFQKRIDQLTYEKNQERRDKEAALALLAEQGKPNGEEKAVTPDVNKLAEQIADKKEFDRRCNDVFFTGNKEYTDFESAVDTLKIVGVMNETFVNTVLDLPDPHKVLYFLGKNPDDAARISELSPTKQALELARLESKLSTANSKPLSKAPEPIKASIQKNSSAGYATKYYPDMPMDEYMEWRKKEGIVKR